VRTALDFDMFRASSGVRDRMGQQNNLLTEKIMPLNQHYLSALKALQLQGNAALNGDKDALLTAQTSMAANTHECTHIYRIIMTESVPVNEMTEERLAGFLQKEADGLVDYSAYREREGLDYVDLNEDVEIYPSKKSGCFSTVIEGEKCVLAAGDATSMLNQLQQMGNLALITETMQSLSQRVDGTNLQTAFPDLASLKACIEKGLALPASFLEKLTHWEKLGATEVNFDFVELAR
tara:strand:- start:612 stop:1319 length:708 start_codon:yes stop_codon:yes gene_type:complete